MLRPYKTIDKGNGQRQRTKATDKGDGNGKDKSKDKGDRLGRRPLQKRIQKQIQWQIQWRIQRRRRIQGDIEFEGTGYFAGLPVAGRRRRKKVTTRFS